MSKISIIIPTFNHGDLISSAIESVKRQSHQDWELLVIGDGCPEVTKRIMHDYCSRDTRIRFFDFEKDSRHGEVYRHRVLTEYALGTFVCYLCDDDLWLPTHLAQMHQLLATHDFVHALAVIINTDQSFHLHPGHLKHEQSRQRILNGDNFIPLSTVGHTMDLYKRLPHGWRTTPLNVYTDLYMWQQILPMAQAPYSACIPTVVNLPQPLRKHLNHEARKVELEQWLEKISAPEYAQALQSEVLDFLIHDRASIETSLKILQDEIKGLINEVTLKAEALSAVEKQLHETNVVLRDTQTRYHELGTHHHLIFHQQKDQIALLEKSLSEYKATS